MIQIPYLECPCLTPGYKKSGKSIWQNHGDWDILKKRKVSSYRDNQGMEVGPFLGVSVIEER